MAQTRSPETSLQASRPRTNSVRLLMFENAPADARSNIRILKRAGYLLKSDVAGGLTAFGDYLRRADYDLVLSGHEVGNSIGLNALEILRASRHDVPFILVATALGEEMAVEYFRRGATNYVRKDRLNQLPSAVEEALRSLAYRKQSMTLQQQILGAKREWELTFDAVPDPVLVIGEDCRIQKANRATSRVFGLPFEQIIGRPCYEVVHGKSDPLPTCPHQSLLRTGQDSPGDIEDLASARYFSPRPVLCEIRTGNFMAVYMFCMMLPSESEQRALFDCRGSRWKTCTMP